MPRTLLSEAQRPACLLRVLPRFEQPTRRWLLNAAAFVCLALQPMLAQDAGWRFWSRSDGLAESFSMAITRESDGEIWIKHGDVLNMSVLDGYNVRQVADPRLLSARGKWAAGSSGLVHFESGVWRSYRCGFPGVPSNGSASASGIGDNRALYRTSAFIAEFSTKDKQYRIIRRAEQGRIGGFVSATHVQDGYYWVEGQRGLGLLRLDSTPYHWTEFSEQAVGLRVSRLMPMPDGEAFFSGVSLKTGKPTLVRFDGHRFRFVLDGTVDRMFGWRGPGSSIWAYDGAHILRFSKSGPRPVAQNGVLSGDLYAVFSLRSGEFWLATSAGLAHFENTLWRSAPGSSCVDRSVPSILDDRRGSVWFACANTLARWSQGQWKFFTLPKHSQSFAPFLTTSLAPLPDDKLLIKTGSRGGAVLILDPRTGRFQRLVHPRGRRLGIFVPRADGTVWIQTNAADSTDDLPDYRLEIFNGRRFQTVYDFGRNWKLSELRYIYENRNGDLWLGGTSPDGGIGWIHNGRYRVFTRADGYTGNGAFAIVGLSDGSILAGGRDRLLSFDGRRWSPLFDDVDEVRHIIQARDGTIWAASDRGLHHYEHGIWISYTSNDGLPSSIASTVIEDQSGRILSGTSRGAAIFDRSADRDAPRTVIPADVNPAEAPPSGKVNIFFSGVDKWGRTGPERLLFSYRIDGKTWSVFTASHKAAFVGLRPGHHRFEVRAMDLSGNISPVASSVDFTVLRPWYRQGGFLAMLPVIVVVLTILISIVVRRVAVRRLRRRLQIVRQEVALTRERTRIAQDLHDDLGARLTHATLLFELCAQNGIRDGYLVQGQTVVRQAIKSLEETVWAISPRNNTLPELIGYIGQYALEFMRNANIRCALNLPDNPPDIPVTCELRHDLFLVLKEVLNNVVKHAHATEVQLDVELRDHNLSMVVADNGRGFDELSIDRLSNGLRNMRSRAQKNHGSLDIRSKVGEGTRIEVHISLA